MALASTLKSLALTGLLLQQQGVHARIGEVAPRSLQTPPDDTGAVYIMTNRVSGVGNSVLVFDRNVTDGTLERVGLFDTGGLGGLGGGLTEFPGDFPNGVFGTPNDALASQNSLLLSESRRCLFAANPGSDTVTTFRVSNDGKCLNRVGIYPSGGNFPVSVTQRGNTVYVLNAGNDATVSGFRYGDRLCTLSPLAQTTRSLNSVNTNPPFFLSAPAQVSITPNGKGLVATLKGMNNIHYWSLSALGFPAQEQVITPSNGFTPFSFTFDANDNLLVSEANGSADVAPSPATPNSGAVSSYRINDDDGTLTLISGSVPTGQTETCWIQYFNGYAYTTNAPPPRPSVSIFSVDDQGRLDLVESVAADIEQGIDRPIDFGLSQDGEFLYSLNTGSIEEDGAGRASIVVFKNNGSSLDLVQIVKEGVPLSTTTPQFEDTQGVVGLAVL